MQTLTPYIVVAVLVALLVGGVTLWIKGRPKTATACLALLLIGSLFVAYVMYQGHTIREARQRAIQEGRMPPEQETLRINGSRNAGCQGRPTTAAPTRQTTPITLAWDGARRSRCGCATAC